MKTEPEIDSMIHDTMTRLDLNWGSERAVQDQEGAAILVSAHEHARAIGYEHGAAQALMFLGRILEIRKEYLGAKLFYLSSKTIFRRLGSMHWVPAKEFHNELRLRGIRNRRVFAERMPAVESEEISPSHLVEEFFLQYLQDG